MKLTKRSTSTIAFALILASSAFAWDCPAPYIKIKESPGWVYCGVTTMLVTVQQGPAGPAGPSFDPLWGTTWFAVAESDGSLHGILNRFSRSWGYTITPLPTTPSTSPIPTLPRNDEYWMRAKDGSVDYSSDGELWHAQTQSSGAEVFLGCYNGGAFWVERVL